MTEPKPGDWLDVHGLPARVAEAADNRLVVDVFPAGAKAPQRRTYFPSIHGPFPPLPEGRIPKGAE